MSVLDPFETICRVTKKSPKLEDGEVLLKLNDIGEQVKSRLTRVAYRVVVDTSQPIELESITLTVSDFRSKTSIQIPLRIKLWFVEQGIRFVKSLVTSDKTAKQLLTSIMQNCLQKASEARGDITLAQWVYKEQEAIEKMLVDRLLEWNIASKVVIETASFKPKSLHLHLPMTKVKTKDTNEMVKVGLDLYIDPISGALQKGPVNLSDWESLLKRWCEEHVERTETLQQYFCDSEFNARLEGAIIARLKALGWQEVNFIVSKEEPDCEISFTKVFDVCWVSMSKRKFNFKVKLNLEIADAGKYYNSGKRNLSEVGQQILDKSFEAVLIEEDIRNFNPSNFEQIKDKIESFAKQEAVKLGLTVITLVPDPQLVEWTLLKQQNYKIEARDYPTQNAKMKANFSIAITGRVRDIERAFAINDSEQSLAAHIKAIVTDDVEMFTSRIDYGDYIENFLPRSDPHALEQSDKVYIEPSLKAEIIKSLSEKLDFEVNSISIIRHDPELWEKANEIINLPKEKDEFSIYPAGSPPEECYLIKFEVLYKLQPFVGENLALGGDLKLHDMKGTVVAELNKFLRSKTEQDIYDSLNDPKINFENTLTEKLSEVLPKDGFTVRVDQIKISQHSQSRKNSFLSEYQREIERAVARIKLDTYLTANETECDGLIQTMEEDNKVQIEGVKNGRGTTKYTKQQLSSKKDKLLQDVNTTLSQHEGDESQNPDPDDHTLS